MTQRFQRWALPALCMAALASPIFAANVCPPPPNPYGKCSLDIDRFYFEEYDANQDGYPDTEGSGGDFCNGSSPSSCGGYPSPAIAFELFITDPARQGVTCTLPGASVSIMSIDCNECLASGFNSATLPAGSTTSSQVQVVVSDDNGDVCFCAGPLSCTFSVEVECSDGGDGDFDGLVDDADPDCICTDLDEDSFCDLEDCNDEDPTVHSLPPLVNPLLMSVVGRDTFLNWDTTGPEIFADIATGLISDLRGDSGFTSAFCLVEGEPGSSYWDSRLAPPEGEAFYYLTRLENSCGTLGYGESTAGVTARDGLNAASPCPL